MSPEECNSERDVIALDRSVIEVGRFTMMVTHEGVYLSEHVGGQPAKGSVSIPRATFRKFLDWYSTDQDHLSARATNTNARKRKRNVRRKRKEAR